MKYPLIEINLPKIKDNFNILNQKLANKGIKLTVVTKGFAGDEKIFKALIDSGVDSIADSRLDNIKKFRDLNYKGKVTLLRIPQRSEIKEAVSYIDYSLVSEKESCLKISKEAVKNNKKIGVIVMVDIGDRREGVMPEDIINFITEIRDLPGVSFKGIGTNLGCYGGIIPDENNTEKLVNLKEKIEKKLGNEVEIISGGNTATTNLLKNDILKDKINNLRVGEAILLANDVTNQREIDYLKRDAFKIKAEIIELKHKPSLPEGKQGLNFSGEKLEFEDKGISERSILAIGSQDVDHNSLTSELEGVEILGSSSDHLIIDLSNCEKELSYGDKLTFNLGYSALLRAMTSPYVAKKYLD